MVDMIVKTGREKHNADFGSKYITPIAVKSPRGYTFEGSLIADGYVVILDFSAVHICAFWPIVLPDFNATLKKAVAMLDQYASEKGWPKG